MSIFLIKLKNFLISKLAYMGILLLISIVIFFICFAALANYTFFGACDALFITAAILIGVGGLQIAGNQGTFDLMAYSFANLAASYRKGGEKKYQDVVEYRNLKQSKRDKAKYNFVFYFVYGLFYLIGAIICYFLIY